MISIPKKYCQYYHFGLDRKGAFSLKEPLRGVKSYWVQRQLTLLNGHRVKEAMMLRFPAEVRLRFNSI
jgi:hypothetical protein